MKTTITVTKADIKAGTPGCRRTCALVIAFRRIVRPEWVITVEAGMARFYLPRKFARLYSPVPNPVVVALPTEAVSFVWYFDCCSATKAKPFYFLIELPDVLLRSTDPAIEIGPKRPREKRL